MGLRSKLWNLHTWWYHRPSTPTGPLPKIGHTHFIFVLLHSLDKLSHHSKFYQNRLKNKKVTVYFLSAQFVPEENSENDKTWNSRFLKKIHSKDIVTAIVMPAGIFWIIVSMFMKYCKTTKIFIIWNIF